MGTGSPTGANQAADPQAVAIDLDVMRRTLLLLVTIVSGCDRAEVVIHNHSPVDLRNVTVSAKGASTSIDLIERGHDGRTTLCPSGEAGSVELSFVADGKEHRQSTPVYFECDFLYRVEFDVSKALDVNATATLKTF